MNLAEKKPAGLFRRLAANIYDSVILVALWIVATFLLLPFTHGKAIPAGTLWYQLYCLAIMIFYYCASWHYYQQTIGMRAWRIKLMDQQGAKPAWAAALFRFFYAILAYASLIGVWLQWHDRLSKTQLMPCDEIE